MEPAMGFEPLTGAYLLGDFSRHYHKVARAAGVADWAVSLATETRVRREIFHWATFKGFCVAPGFARTNLSWKSFSKI